MEPLDWVPENFRDWLKENLSDQLPGGSFVGQQTKERSLADAFDCGRHVHETWKRGAEHITRWLGPYDPTMPLDTVHARLEHEKQSETFRSGFERGWQSVQLTTEIKERSEAPK